MRHFFDTIEGWFDFEDVYSDAVKRAGPAPRLVEVGVGLGRSLAYLSVECANAGNDAEVIGVDLFNWPTERDNLVAPWAARCAAYRGAMEPSHLAAVEHNLAPVGQAVNVRLLPLPSVEAAATFADESCDLVFIDGEHDFAHVTADLDAWWPKVKPGGVFAGHDYPPDFGFEVAEAVDKWMAERGIAFEVWGSSWRTVKGKA